ncbi:carcinine hydrolase/isopenicillin-N N-acyltransferase family protein [Lujinxingia vulgaris]|nr:carcinine hydrolase/isopenicillin-N N-acyltransferase family protein [Lujinxingia vulgaris]
MSSTSTDGARSSEPGQSAARAVYYPERAGGLGRVTTPVGDVHVANVSGPLTSAGRDLGRRLATELREGAHRAFDDYVQRISAESGSRVIAAAGRVVGGAVLPRLLRQRLPAEHLQILTAFAEGAGLDVEEALATQQIWDQWAWARAGNVAGLVEGRLKARSHSPLLASSAVVVPTDTCGVLHAFSFENAAVERWDRAARVVVMHPDHGFSYALVSSLGFLTGLPAGMNAAGLTLSTHPGPAALGDRAGVPLGPAALQVLNEARTIEEAVAILRQHPPMTSWTYVLSEGASGRRAKVEVSPLRVGVEVEEGRGLFVRGGPSTAELQRSPALAREEARRDAHLGSLIATWRSDRPLPLMELARGLGGDSEAAPGSDAIRIAEVMSVIFEPAAGRLWVAAGRAPTALRWFVPLRLRGAHGEARAELDTRVEPVQAWPTWQESARGRAADYYRNAYRLYLEGEDPQRLLITLEYAVALEPTSARYHVLAGLVALSALRGRRAEGAFRRALDAIDEAGRRAEVGLYLGWALDLQGRRKAARELYARVSDDAQAHGVTRRAAAAARRRRFSNREAQRLHIDFVLASAL